MKLDQYIKKPSDRRIKKYKTVNVDQDIHHFFKKTANHYEIAFSDLMYNILSIWKKEYEKEIRRDIMNQFKNE